MRTPDRARDAGATRISRTSVPSACSTGGTSRHSRSCSPSVARPHPVTTSGNNRAAKRSPCMALRYANRRIPSPAPPCPLRSTSSRRIFCASCETMSMPESEPKRIGLSVEVKPHAYDPANEPELFEGVLSRRLLAFVIDLIILAMPVVFVAMFIFVIGVVTFGLGFVFYALLTPAMVLWADRNV